MADELLDEVEKLAAGMRLNEEKSRAAWMAVGQRIAEEWGKDYVLFIASCTSLTAAGEAIFGHLHCQPPDVVAEMEHEFTHYIAMQVLALSRMKGAKIPDIKTMAEHINEMFDTLRILNASNPMAHR